MKKRKVLFFVGGFILFFYPCAFSFSLRIDKPKLKLKVRPGQTINGSISVENPSSESLKVKVYIEDFNYVSPFDGTKEFLPPGSTKFSCANWINFSPQEFVLPPLGKREISYSVNVPAQASGGYYSVLFFETTFGETKDAQGHNVLVLGRVGSLFFLELEDSFKKLGLEDTATSRDKINIQIHNLGNTVLVGKGVFSILDSQNLVVDRGETNEFFLPPASKTWLNLSLSSDLSPGEYQGVLTLDLEDGDVKTIEILFSKDTYGDLKILKVEE